MSAWGFISKIAQGAFQTGAKSVEFVGDIIQEGLTDEDEFEGDGIADTIWGSFNDNILGEGGALQGAIGPEGVGGTIIGAIPEPIRNVSESVLTPVMDFATLTYKTLIDDPLGAAVTLADITFSDGGGFGELFDTDTWSRAWDIAETRSLGQSVALAALAGNILDEEEVAAAQDTSMYQLISGTTDALANIILDPLNFIGKPIMMATKWSRNGRWMGTGAEKFVETRGFSQFSKQIDDLADTLDGTFSETFYKEGVLSEGDKSLVDALAGKIQKKFGDTEGFTPELAYALARTSGEAAVGAGTAVKNSRKLVVRLAMGDPKARALIEDSASAWSNSLQPNGALTKLSEQYNQLENLKLEARNAQAATPVGSGGDLSDALVDAFDETVQTTESFGSKITELENKIAIAERDIAKDISNAASELPFVDALNMKELDIRKLSKFVDETEDSIAANARFEALNEKPQLITAAADMIIKDVVGEGQFGVLLKAPKVNIIQGLGYGVSTFVSDLPYLGAATSAVGRKVSVFHERVPQGLMKWDDPDQSFTQFQRMIRDAERVKAGGVNIFEYQKINSDELLGQWTRMDQGARKALFTRTIKDINEGVINLFGDKILKGVADKDKQDVLRLALRRMKGNIDSAQASLNAQSMNARVYGNGSLSFDMAQEGMQQYRRHVENFTPQQLREASIVPRYDLISDLFDKGTLGKGLKSSQDMVQELTGVWKKSVLLRPAWPIRVLSDELGRSAALLGGIDTMRGVMAGFGDLRAAWFRRQGIDVMSPSIQKMRNQLTEKGIETSDDVGALYSKYADEFGADEVEKLVKGTINDEYGRSRIVRRTGALSALGMFAMGPAGLAAAGMYGLYARKSMRTLAIKEIGTTFADDLRSIARSQLDDEVASIWKKAEGSNKTLTMDQAATEVKNLTKASELLELQSKTLLRGPYVQQVDNSRNSIFKNKTDRELKRIKGELDPEVSKALMNFDKVGQLMSDARVGGYYMGGFKFSNQFGDTPYEVQMNKQALSSDKSNKAIANSINKQSTQEISDVLRPRKSIAYDDVVNKNPKTFGNAYDDTVNKQWKPEGEEYGREFQDFTRLFWDRTKSDETIFRWVKSNDAKRLREAMPMHTATDENIIKWVAAVRRETTDILPIVKVGDVDDIFEVTRQRLFRGQDISWEQHVVPALTKATKTDDVLKAIETVREIDPLNFGNFGRVVGESTVASSLESASVFAKAGSRIDGVMKSLGTMPVDNLSRSTVFAGVYRREVARRVQAYRNADGSYSLTPDRLKSIETAARRQGLNETRSLLYDLAERGRFEEMVGSMMPFYGAWQEVITTWSGLAVKNPVFVARGIRYFKALETEDEEGNTQFVWRLPEGLLSKELMGKKAFGKLGELGFTSLRLNPQSMSMISAGLPGFGPLVSSVASETIIRNPGLQESLDWMLPYGASEGTSMVGRVAQQIEPTFVRRIAGAYFNTAERQKMLAQVSIDLAVQWELNGNEILDEEMIGNFEKEAERRTTDLLKIRALAGLAIPMSFSVQSPYHDVIQGYRKKTEKDGFEDATTWLLKEHGEEFFALTARRTMVRGVASGTLQGEEKYQQHKDFADNNPLLKDFIIGKVGAEDVQFEFNYAVYKTEIAEGRRERATPEEILRKPQENLGWTEWGGVRNAVYDELERRSQVSGSASLRAKSNMDLRTILENAKTDLRSKYPLWWEEYKAPQDPLELTKIIKGFKKVLDDDTFDYRPELVQLNEYMEVRDAIQQELANRAEQSGDLDMRSIKNRNNQDLEDLWENARVSIRNVPQFTTIFDRYLENDTIEYDSWQEV
tara:strand:- start:4513 stop:9945 length:5433 start_codon:yes stop_codon:yes gene_type:complete